VLKVFLLAVMYKITLIVKLLLLLEVDAKLPLIVNDGLMLKE
jgi:hypothetical protein